MLPLSAISTSPRTPERSRYPSALAIQLARVSASSRQGIKIVSSVEPDEASVNRMGWIKVSGIVLSRNVRMAD